jgi:hypothetical protein
MKEAAIHFAFFVSYAIHVPGHDFYTFGSMEVHFPVEDLTRLVHVRQIENFIKGDLVSNSGYPNDTVVALINWKRLADDDAPIEEQPAQEEAAPASETAEIRQFKRKSK